MIHSAVYCMTRSSRKNGTKYCHAAENTAELIICQLLKVVEHHLLIAVLEIYIFTACNLSLVHSMQVGVHNFQ